MGLFPNGRGITTGFPKPGERLQPRKLGGAALQESPLEETGSGGFSLVEEWQLPIGGAVARAEKTFLCGWVARWAPSGGSAIARLVGAELPHRPPHLNSNGPSLIAQHQSTQRAVARTRGECWWELPLDLHLSGASGMTGVTPVGAQEMLRAPTWHPPASLP